MRKKNLLCDCWKQSPAVLWNGIGKYGAQSHLDLQQLALNPVRKLY